MREVYDLLVPYVKKHKGPFLSLNIATLIAAISQTLIPLQISRIIDSSLTNPDKSGVYSGFFIILGLAAIDLIAGISQRFSSVQISARIINDIRQDLYQTLQHQELEFYSSETIGQIMSRSIEEVLSLQEILTWGYRIATLLIFLFLASFIAMIQISVPLSFVYIIIPFILFRIAIGSSKQNVKLFYDARFKYGEMNETLAENLSGIKTVKSFNNEQHQIAIFNVRNQEYFDASLRTAKIRANLQAVMVFIISISLMVLIFIGGIMVVEGIITPGNYVAFMLLTLQIAVPGRFAGWLGIIFQNTQSAAIRLNEIFKAPTLLKEKENALELGEINGSITFDNVSFNYPNKGKSQGHHTLHNVNLKIEVGQKIALLGPTGSGKTSLINLIPRFFDPTEGDLFIDSYNIKDVTTKSLRNHIGIVHQEAFLFTLSIHDNIAFGDVDATRDDVIKAATAAQIHDFINGLEQGYDTIVGERGVTLSGGQRQRVTIARTLLHNPKILIFDDSVSAVDPETEGKIQKSLESVSGSRTTIIISQRPSSLRYVDRIIVLDKGHIVQDGIHDDLITQDGIYKDFINAVENQVKFLDWDADSTTDHVTKLEESLNE